MNRIYTCTDHKEHWPVGVASIVIAPDKKQARLLLEQELEKYGLGGGKFTLQKVDLTKPQAIVLNDGNY